MARAGRVKNIHPGESLEANGRRIIATRLYELISWRAALADPTLVTELHDMRIAAKRLRYALEFFQLCFPDTKQTLRDLADMQEDLGDIHDLDVLTDILRRRLAGTESGLEGEATEIMASDLSPRERHNQLRRVLYAQARDPRRLGLLGLLGDKIADRRRRYAKVQRRWGEGRLETFALRLRHQTGIVPREAPVEAADGKSPPVEERIPVPSPVESGQAQ